MVVLAVLVVAFVAVLAAQRALDREGGRGRAAAAGGEVAGQFAGGKFECTLNRFPNIRPVLNAPTNT
jgi:outer membrane lipoprotein SlyB